MKTPSTAKIILTGVAIVLISLIVFLYLNGSYMELMLKVFSKKQYNDNYTWNPGRNMLFFLLFGVVSFSINLITLKRTGRLTTFHLWFQCILDQIAIPISIFIMVMYYNGKELYSPGLSSLLNPIAVGFLLVIKHAVILGMPRGYKSVRERTSH
jgi:hypothetical protein